MSYRLIINVYRKGSDDSYQFGYIQTPQTKLNMLQFSEWLREHAYRIEPQNQDSEFLAIAQIKDPQTGKTLDSGSLRCS